MKRKKKNPFTTPENYFDNFQDRLMDKLSKEEHIIPSNSGFETPDTYFENFQERLNSKLKKEDVKVISLFPYKKVMAVAASIAAIVLVYFGLNSKNTDINFTDLANVDIEAYFDNNEFDLTSYDIAEVIPLENTEMSDMLNSPLDDELIIDYLDENTNGLNDLNLPYDE